MPGMVAEAVLLWGGCWGDGGESVILVSGFAQNPITGVRFDPKNQTPKQELGSHTQGRKISGTGVWLFSKSRHWNRIVIGKKYVSSEWNFDEKCGSRIICSKKILATARNRLVPKQPLAQKEAAL